VDISRQVMGSVIRKAVQNFGDEMNSSEFVSLKQLAEALSMDRSHARKYILKQGFKPEKRRTSDSGGMLALSFTKEEAERIIALRRDQGFFGASLAKPVSEEKGVFYVIQLVPEYDPNRIKLGFTSDIEDRLQHHRTSAPTAVVKKVWPCRKSWEVTAIAAITAIGCKLILGEVFECENLEQLLVRAEAFFSLLPEPGFLLPLANCSPLNQPMEGDSEDQEDESFEAEEILNRESA
jgi:hypothetical protein